MRARNPQILPSILALPMGCVHVREAKEEPASSEVKVRQQVLSWEPEEVHRLKVRHAGKRVQLPGDEDGNCKPRERVEEEADSACANELVRWLVDLAAGMCVSRGPPEHLGVLRFEVEMGVGEVHVEASIVGDKNP